MTRRTLLSIHPDRFNFASIILARLGILSIVLPPLHSKPYSAR
jgi:hypothetical protein